MTSRRRVKVRSGVYRGLMGWGYFSGTQEEWDSVHVVLDHVDFPLPSCSGSALGAATRPAKTTFAFGPSPSVQAAAKDGRRYGISVRLNVRELTVLSELEAIACEVEEAEPVRLPRLTQRA